MGGTGSNELKGAKGMDGDVGSGALSPGADADAGAASKQAPRPMGRGMRETNCVEGTGPKESGALRESTRGHRRSAKSVESRQDRCEKIHEAVPFGARESRDFGEFREAIGSHQRLVKSVASRQGPGGDIHEEIFIDLRKRKDSKGSGHAVQAEGSRRTRIEQRGARPEAGSGDTRLCK